MCAGIPKRIMVEVSVIPPPRPANPVASPPAKLLRKINPGLFILYEKVLLLESIFFRLHPLFWTDPLVLEIFGLSRTGSFRIISRIDKDIMKTIPVVDMFASQLKQLMDDESGIIAISEKVEKKGIMSLTRTEQDKWISAQAMLNSVNFALMFDGTQLPMTKQAQRFLRSKIKDKKKKPLHIN